MRIDNPIALCKNLNRPNEKGIHNMSEFIGTLKNKTTGQSQNVTDRNPNNEWDNDYTIKVEGDRRWHGFGRDEYDFIPARKNAQEQFEDLAIGDVFKLDDGSSFYRVKVSATRYYSEFSKQLHYWSTLSGSANITKKEN